MQQIKVTLKPTKDYYKVMRNGVHIKTCKVQYIAELIDLNGWLFLCNDKKEISAEEKCALATYHYRNMAKTILVSKQVYHLAEKLGNSEVTNKRVRYVDEERIYSIIFESGLEVNVDPLHFRMFAIKPLLKDTTIQFHQETLAI